MILVTGGEGTLGKRLVNVLRSQGEKVFVCDLRHESSPDYMRCDIARFDQLERVINQLDKKNLIVYHLAAEFGRMNGEEFTEQCWRTNVIGTKNLIRLQTRHDFKVIFASSSEIYGEVDADLLSEDLTEKLPLKHYNDYAMTKWVNEQQFRNAAEQFGNETMILRFFNAYGPGEYYSPYRSVVCLFIHAALTGRPLNVYQNYHRVFQYVYDMIGTVANSRKAFKAGETYNIGGIEYVSVEELARLVLKTTGSNSELRLISQAEHNVRNKRPDIAKAINDLGHNPSTTLEKGIPLTVEWMKSVYGSA